MALMKEEAQVFEAGREKGGFLSQIFKLRHDCVCCHYSQTTAPWAPRQMPASRGVRSEDTKRRAPSFVWCVRRSPEQSPVPQAHLCKGPPFLSGPIGGTQNDYDRNSHGDTESPDGHGWCKLRRG